MIQTDLFGVCITPEDCFAVPVNCHPYSITSALGRHQSSDYTSMYISHLHITPVSVNELWHSNWKQKAPQLLYYFQKLKLHIVRIYRVMCDFLYLIYWLCRYDPAPGSIHLHSCSGVSQDGLHTAGHRSPRSGSHYSLDDRTNSHVFMFEPLG